MKERVYARREQWERITPDDLRAQELREAAARAEGQLDAFRVTATDREEPVTLEVLWIVGSQRAGVASGDGVFWTNTPTIETALHRWAAGMPRGIRSDLR